MAQLHYRSILSKSYAAMAVLLLLVLLPGACSNSEAAPEPTAAPKLTAAEVVELSKTSMGNIDSFSFQLTHDSGHTTLSGALQLTLAGGFVATDGLDLEAEASIGRLFVKVEAVVIEEQTWMTNPITGVWSEIAPEDSPFAFLDPVKLVADILGDTQQATYAKDDQASNGDIEISGKIPAKSLAALVGYVNPDAIPNVVLTIDSSSNLLKKIIISGVVQSEDEPGTIRVITLSDFDEPSTIEPPI
ncbi:MAG: LppX_LprAFG lipoprotein [Dehalococcoidia bacterium]|nr:LppX_LprAFG lipoprotein [Dehalococcoidia bacterium]